MTTDDVKTATISIKSPFERHKQNNGTTITELFDTPLFALATHMINGITFDFEGTVGAALKKRGITVDSLFVSYLATALSHVNLTNKVAISDLIEQTLPALVASGAFSLRSDISSAVRGVAVDLHEAMTEAGVVPAKSRRLAAPVKANTLDDAIAAQRKKWLVQHATMSIVDLQVEYQGKQAMEQFMRRKKRRSAKKATYVPEGPDVQAQAINMDANQRDIRLCDVNVSFGPVELLHNINITFAYGRRYGIIGANGLGKSTLLRQIANREIPVPEGLHVLYISQEVPPSEKRVLDIVLEADEERTALVNAERDLSKLMSVYDDNAADDAFKTHGVNLATYFAEAEDDATFFPEEEAIADALGDVYASMDEIDAFRAEARAKSILAGLGFSSDDCSRRVSEFSGGWRMRLQLAAALFIQPDVLMLDEPTNHLDLEATLWLQEYIANYPSTVIVVSHEQSFLDRVCTDIVRMANKRMRVYANCNFTRYCELRETEEAAQKRAYERQQQQLAVSERFIERFRFKAKRAAQVQGRIKMLDKMTKVAAVLDDPTISFKFPEAPASSGTVLALHDVTFQYPPSAHSTRAPFRLTNVDMRVSGGARLAIVGRNGSGKSTMVKLIAGELEPSTGYLTSAPQLDIAYYSQVHADAFGDCLDGSSVAMFAEKFPKSQPVTFRTHMGSFGLTGDVVTQPIRTLSGGQRARLALALMTFERTPSVLVLDEPTNHLDLESRQALAMALNEYNGTVIVISHDEMLIKSVCDELIVVKDNKVHRFAGDFDAYAEGILREVTFSEVMAK